MPAAFSCSGRALRVGLVPLIWSAVEPENTLRALKAFKEDYPEASTCLLYRGQEEIRIGDILCLPCDTFLKKLNPSSPLL